jgi:hypothetical protein
MQTPLPTLVEERERAAAIPEAAAKSVEEVLAEQKASFSTDNSGMVETDKRKWDDLQDYTRTIVMPKPAGRVVKPTVAPPAEPLQMVETKK